MSNIPENCRNNKSVDLESIPFTRMKFRDIVHLSREERQMDLNMMMDSQGGIPIGFFSVEDLIAMTGWSKGTILKLFDDPKFPSADFGRRQIIEAHALVDYFSVRHEKGRDRHWKTGD